MASTIKMAVSKSNPVAGGKRIPLGEVTVNLFALNEFNSAFPAPNSINDDGFPVYSDESLAYVSDAVVAAQLTNARNCLAPASLNLTRPLPTTIAELLAKAERSGEALAIHREALDLFIKDYLPKSGRNAAAQKVITNMAKSRELVASSSEKRKEVFGATLSAWVDTLTEEQATKYARVIEGFTNALNTEAIDDDEL